MHPDDEVVDKHAWMMHIVKKLLTLTTGSMMQVAMTPAFPEDLKRRLTNLLKGLLNVDSTTRWTAVKAQSSLGILMNTQKWDNDVFPIEDCPKLKGLRGCLVHT